MKIHRLLVSVLIMCSIVTLAGCGYTPEEKVMMAQYEEQGKKNAISYIEEKYGFIAEVINATCEKNDSSPIPDLSPSPTGGVYVDMQYEEKSFRVYISGEEETIEGYDNYQADIIEDAIEQKVADIVGNVEGLEICYGQFRELAGQSNYGLVNTYYDGGNLSKVLGDARCNTALISVVDTRLDAIEHGMIQESFGENAYYAIVNYRSQEDYNAKGNTSFNFPWNPIELGIDRYAFFIEDYKVFTSKEEEYEHYVLEQYDNFYYCFTGGTYCNVEKTSMDAASNWNGRGFINAEQIYEGYSFDTDASSVIVWVPYENLGMTEERKVRVGTQYTFEDSTVYDDELTDIIGDGKYITAQIYIFNKTDIKFSLFTDLE